MTLLAVRQRHIAPERKFWCDFIHDIARDASKDDPQAKHWFSSHMWENLSSMLFSRDEILAIEDRALSGQPIGKRRRKGSR